MTDVVVLCYHAVSPDWPAQLAVTPERFEQQLRTLVGRGYRGATFAQAATSPPHPRTLAVTFDDGMRSVLERACPVLAELGLPGTVFVPTDLVGSAGPMRWRGLEPWLGGTHEHELVPLTWQELRGLQNEGWEIGSHTRTHPRLTQLDDEALRAELGQSRDGSRRSSASRASRWRTPSARPMTASWPPRAKRGTAQPAACRRASSGRPL